LVGRGLVDGRNPEIEHRAFHRKILPLNPQII